MIFIDCRESSDSQFIDRTNSRDIQVSRDSSSRSELIEYSSKSRCSKVSSGRLTNNIQITCGCDAECSDSVKDCGESSNTMDRTNSRDIQVSGDSSSRSELIEDSCETRSSKVSGGGLSYNMKLPAEVIPRTFRLCPMVVNPVMFTSWRVTSSRVSSAMMSPDTWRSPSMYATTVPSVDADAT